MPKTIAIITDVILSKWRISPTERPNSMISMLSERSTLFSRLLTVLYKYLIKYQINYVLTFYHFE